MSRHRPRTYSRWARIKRRLLALSQAPTIAEQLSELRPSTGNVLVMSAKTAPAPMARPGA